jgi:hypothetical protein
MISSWLMWALTIGIGVILGIGMWLLAYHRGYIDGLGDGIDRLPVDPPWSPPSIPPQGHPYWGQAAAKDYFMEELLKAERRQPEIQKYPGPKDRR